MNELLHVYDELNLEYGCGIGPKMVMSGGMMGIVGHSVERRDVCLYQIELC